MTEAIGLEALEVKAEQALEKAETGWREFAQTMRTIREREAHKEAGFASFQAYYQYVWQERAGGSLSKLYDSIRALRAVEEMEVVAPRDLTMPASARTARVLAAIEDPIERVDFWREEVLPDKPSGRISSEAVSNRLAEYKGEPTVRDVLTPEDMADLPTGRFTEEQEWASRTSKLVGPITRMTPTEVADACYGTYPDRIKQHIIWAEQISQWYAEYAEQLVAFQRQGLRDVNQDLSKAK